MQRELKKYSINKLILKSPILIGLSQGYYFNFFIAVFGGLLLLPILVLIFNQTTLIAISISTILLLYYGYLRLKRKKYGDNPAELKSHRSQTKEIIIDNANIFIEQAN